MKRITKVLIAFGIVGTLAIQADFVYTNDKNQIHLFSRGLMDLGRVYNREK